MSLAVKEHWVLGRYRIVRRLAQGGMGVVYLGRLEGAAGFAKPVIIKRIIPDTRDLDQSVARFIREAQILSNLQHPGIVGVLDFGKEEDGYAMILEYVHGYDLGRWIRFLQVKPERMHWEEAVLITVRVLDALSYAHTFHRNDGAPAGILHRDISPGNILLDLEGQVRLLDFGIARMAEGEAGQYKTEEGVLKGKVAYLAPELFAGSPPSASSDIYACAVVLYQMLTGAHPFTGDNDSQVMYRVVTETPRRLSAIRSDVPSALEEAVATALHKDPEGRHFTAETLARDLRKTLTRPETDIVSAMRERLRRDFTGPMASLLGLVPLSERDQAWRSCESTQRHATPLRSSPLPAPVVSQPPTAGLGRREAITARKRVANSETTLTSSAQGQAQSRFGHPLLLPVIGAAVVLAALAGGALFVLEDRTAAPVAGRFILVESPDRASRPNEAPRATGASTEPSAFAPEQATNQDQIAQQGGAGAKAKAPISRETDASALSRQFARRRGAIEVCFKRFTTELQGQPEISVNFEVAASGRVTSASLIPAALNGTPFGQCLLSVARQSSFEPRRKAVRFAIPLRARAVSK